MSFYEIPSIPASNVFRAAMVSATRGERVIEELKREGLVKPVKTPTGRVLLSPADGKAVYEALIQGV